MRLPVLALAVLMTATPALAVLPGERLSDPRLEERARALSKDLRCMVCQNQAIDDSDAPLARDLRVLVRERLTAGDSDRQVIDFLVARYGEFVLLRPRFGWHTAVLWIAPLVFLVAGIAYLFVLVRRRRVAVVTAPLPLTDEEKARLEAALKP
ncbi:MAG: cytochrome c-type biogenesis protein CcmH [Phreatobacter sp.]|uniref:cytochrome c-type biogenesis protein n=1 Tax=Phreatobacter sp. TaxID=1966341 RepID=UPI00273553B4|nr:cytochrome c-type biogenesis protein [Phreatobacter sp.]MDP2800399.1 cytochrome c-type biogenesis protein CcmH [Phreatobacter sp.]